MIRRPPRSTRTDTLFPYPTLVRSRRLGVALEGAGETDMAVSPPPADPVARRIPYFCSGCPHNRSTKLPAGSMGMAGIGCHSMVTFTRPDENLPPTQMGGEGANWFGIAPFSGTRHILDRTSPRLNSSH